MKKAVAILGGAISITAGWLAFAPVSIEPTPWTAPENLGHTGAFAPNTKLVALERLDLAGFYGPEDAAVLDGMIYTTSQSGDILRLDPANPSDVTSIANTGGVPLGIEVSDGALYVADAHVGLVKVRPDGRVEVLSDSVDGTPIDYADDLDIANDGVIYFSDASTKFGAKAHGSTMAASLLEIMESKGTGRLVAYDPRDQSSRVVRSGYVFSNGVAMHPDGDVLVLETGRYRVLKVNPQTGEQTIWIENLPGFPDNINPGPNGTYLLGLISPRSEWLDKNAAKPGARKLAMRLPAFMRPKSVPYGHIVHLNQDGEVLRTFQDPAGGYTDATGALVHNGQIYVTSLHEGALARMAYPALTQTNVSP